MSFKEQFKNATIGKKIGTVAFGLTELLIFVVVILSFIFPKDSSVDYTQIIFYQTIIFGVVWGSKISKNYIDKIKDKEDVGSS